MSDHVPETTLEQTPAANTVAANAQQALAIKELGESVSKMKKQVKTLWIAVIVIAVLLVASTAWSMFGRFAGARMPGGPAGNWQRPGTTNGTIQDGTQGAPGPGVTQP